MHFYEENKGKLLKYLKVAQKESDSRNVLVWTIWFLMAEMAKFMEAVRRSK